ncbi:MAG TPA: acyl-CoA synthetase FdrA [Anaerolineales bacterium]|nr:acyl-CoA synthetase FdrA [Anaerolineales bacterium]
MPIQTQLRHGAYYDSVVLMQLQAALSQLSGVQNVGVMMGTPANKALLAQSGLLTPEAESAAPDDLIISVLGKNADDSQNALAQVDSLLMKRSTGTEGDYLPQSLPAAAKALPSAQWVLVSVPGRYAADVARDALNMGKHVFLYSDNVSLADEIELKQSATAKGLLVMGPDCGTAIINGVGLGFANRVRRGPIGVVGASGTGLQQVTSRIHQLGSGISHAMGTGGRDLKADVGALTARQALSLLANDPQTQVIVLISKPPAPAVAQELLRLARTIPKPVVVNFIGYQPNESEASDGSVWFARTLDGAAQLAVNLLSSATPAVTIPAPAHARYLRGLFSGGTLAYEALLILQDYLPSVYSNAPLDKRYQLSNSLVSQEHTIVDLGEDEFTVGRLHPMLDNTLRLHRLAQEAADPQVGLILLDVVLGDGAHPNPASEIAPAIEKAKETARADGRDLPVVVVVCGTDEDPQNMAEQIALLEAAGAQVFSNNETAIRHVGECVQKLGGLGLANVQNNLDQPFAALNVGLESFAQSLQTQSAAVQHLNWRPPAGGNDKLMALLRKMKG